MHPFLIALQFLTRVPVNVSGEWSAENIGKSLLYYPLVGFIIGALLMLLAYVLQDQSPMLLAALILTCWVLITGGLHLDGLADSADAWAGAHGDKQRALEIMKDSCAGPIAIILLVLVLLIKFSALYVLLQLEMPWLLLLAPMLGRSAVIILFMTTPYVREQGLGSDMKKYLPQQHVYAPLALVLLVLFIFTDFGLALAVTMMGLLTLLFLRHLMLKRIDGMTGDTIGASIEIIETIVLCVLVF
ncbi:MAG TPA: adenosylcobinamide-GDP ribazoletransferase [Gammaproteobacteria bacterium]